MLTPRRHFFAMIFFAALLFPAGVIAYNHLGEDCFITYRYCEQWARGYGVVYNVGERVEGYSNFLWLALLTALRKLGGSPLNSSRWLSMASQAFLLAACGFAVRKIISRDGRTFVPLYCLWLPLAVWLNPLLRYHSDRGLETVFFAALLGGACFAAAGRQWLAGGLLCAMAALARPEGVFFAFAFAPWVFGDFNPNEDHPINAFEWAKAGAILRRAACFLLPPLLAYGGQSLFRHSYYGDWIPNTVAAKIGRGARPPAWPEILRFIIAMNGLPVIAMAGAIYGWKILPDRRRLITCALSLLFAVAACQFSIGLVPCVCYRYMIPAVAPVLILCFIFIEALHSAWENRRWPRRLLPIVSLALCFYVHPHSGKPDTFFAGNTDAARSRFHWRLLEFAMKPDWLERWRWFHNHEPLLINASAGDWLRRELHAKHPETILAADQMGMLGYYASLDQRIIDLGGLMDREIARRGLRVPDILRRAPDFMVLYSLKKDAEPLLPELRRMTTDAAFLERYAIVFRLQPRDSFNQVEFAVWGKRGSGAPPPPPIIPVGPTTEVLERWWRIADSPLSAK